MATTILITATVAMAILTIADRQGAYRQPNAGGYLFLKIIVKLKYENFC